MLDACGAASAEDLFAHLPDAVRLRRPLDLAPGISEYEIADYFRARAGENANGYASFLGAGVYRHYRPVLVDAVVSRGEFLTSYTPYQAEISQGTLTAIFEFQTMICQLTGMDVANASMYDGSTAVPEAVFMAVRSTGRKRVLIARSVHPEYREVLRTYARHQGMPVEEFGYLPEAGTIDLEDLDRKIDDLTAAVVVQSPNFFGIVDHVKTAAEIAHRRGALLIVVFTEAVSLGLLEPPAEADIVAGELQSFAISPSYGGPYAGVIATREKFIRQMPGRLVGQTTDSRGNRAFCLTHSTRDQHIRCALDETAHHRLALLVLHVMERGHELVIGVKRHFSYARVHLASAFHADASPLGQYNQCAFGRVADQCFTIEAGIGAQRHRQQYCIKVDLSSSGMLQPPLLAVAFTSHFVAVLARNGELARCHLVKRQSTGLVGANG